MNNPSQEIVTKVNASLEQINDEPELMLKYKEIIERLRRIHGDKVPTILIIDKTPHDSQAVCDKGFTYNSNLEINDVTNQIFLKYDEFKSLSVEDLVVISNHEMNHFISPFSNNYSRNFESDYIVRVEDKETTMGLKNPANIYWNILGQDSIKLYSDEAKKLYKVYMDKGEDSIEFKEALETSSSLLKVITKSAQEFQETDLVLKSLTANLILNRDNDYVSSGSNLSDELKLKAKVLSYEFYNESLNLMDLYELDMIHKASMRGYADMLKPMEANILEPLYDKNINKFREMRTALKQSLQAKDLSKLHEFFLSIDPSFRLGLDDLEAILFVDQDDDGNDKIYYNFPLEFFMDRAIAKVPAEPRTN